MYFTLFPPALFFAFKPSTHVFFPMREVSRGVVLRVKIADPPEHTDIYLR
jgi:hypothetical protein